MDPKPAAPAAPLPDLAASGVIARIVDAVANPVFVKDEQHRLVFVNDAFSAMLGRPREAIVGRTDFDFVPAEEARVFQAKDKVVFQSGAPHENEESLTDASGKQHWIVTRKSIVTALDGRRYLVGVISDISERRQMELELRAANDSLKAAMDRLANTERLATIGQVAATVSHELRNPLGAIRNSMALVHQVTAGKQLGLDRALERVDRNIERCTTIIGALLEFTQKREIVRTPTRLDAWLSDVLAQHKVPPGIMVERELSTEAEIVIDRERLRQVVANLVDNAVQALKDPVWNPAAGHARRILVSTHLAGPHVRLCIIDNGPGIHPDVLPRIFEPLFTTKNFGVGLGLPTVRQIVEQHGGRIDVDSAVDVGTTATVWLPGPEETAAAERKTPGRAAAE